MEQKNFFQGEQICSMGIYTLTGYRYLMCQRDKKSITSSLNRVSGQVRGIGQMVEDDRYCIDILHQLHAVKAALSKVEDRVLRSHAACCVEEAMASGDPALQRRKFDELVGVFAKAKL